MREIRARIHLSLCGCYRRGDRCRSSARTGTQVAHIFQVSHDGSQSTLVPLTLLLLALHRGTGWAGRGGRFHSTSIDFVVECGIDREEVGLPLCGGNVQRCRSIDGKKGPSLRFARGRSRTSHGRRQEAWRGWLRGGQRIRVHNIAGRGGWCGGRRKHGLRVV